ncbi:MAG: hypothetical protein AAGD05_07630, partial [Bacteroidota bacterium]
HWAEGQTLKAYQKAAVKAEEERNYSAALANYQIIINEAGKETDHNFYRAAESARKMKIYPLAEDYYQRVLAGEQKANYPLADYWLGYVLKQQGKYELSKVAYQRYLEGSGAGGGEKAEKAQQEIIDCDWAAQVVAQPSPLEIKHLDENVNTANTEIAPLLKEDVLYFSSLRESHANGFCEFPTTRIYQAKADNESTLLDVGFTETNKHSAHTTFGADGKTMYYTLCEDLAPDTTRCTIYSRQQASDGNWGAAQALPSGINSGKYTATQPSIGVDANEKELLFFVSDRPGGAGGLDIWCAYLESNGAFGAPFNVAEINTAGDDITPFFHNDFQTLYYSSNGRQNLGGFDIYHTQKEGGGWSEVKHAGYPLNSSYDDTYYSINTTAGKAHFSSNRPGGICSDTSNYCVCNDIYKIEPQIAIKVLTYNEITRAPLNGTSVELTSPELKDFVPQVHTKPNDYIYNNDHQVNFYQGYQLLATKKRYTSSQVQFRTPLPIVDTTLVIEHYLRPEVDLNVQTYDQLSGLELNGVKVELIELPTAASLDAQEEALKNDYNFGLTFKRRYMVVGTKAGFSSDTAYVTTEDIPIVPTTLNAKLLLCKALPPFETVRLFFDNDSPDPANMRVTTQLTYREAYDAYVRDYDQRLGYYKNDAVHTPTMDTFFVNEVKEGYRDLESLANNLVNYFEAAGPSGNILITIRGFASLRSNPVYNKALTSRRISSVRNYFNQWTDDSGEKRLDSYLDRIVVTEAPKGDEDACKTCYKKAAITDTKACEDRRVEIIDVKVTRNPCDIAKENRKK